LAETRLRSRQLGDHSCRVLRELDYGEAEIQRLDSRAARWIAADAIKEPESEAVQARLAA